MSGNYATLHQNKTFRFFSSENPSFGKNKHFLSKTTTLEEHYSNVRKDLRTKNFQPGFFLDRAIGKFHVNHT